MTTWSRPHLRLLSNADAVHARCDCRAQDYRHAALFRAELVNGSTGEVHRATLCHDRAKLFAENHHLEFPPWRDQGAPA